MTIPQYIVSIPLILSASVVISGFGWGVFEKIKNSLAEGDSLCFYPQIIPKSQIF
jgi:hypothetical protein